MKSLSLSLDKLDVPSWLERGLAKTDDDTLRKSIEQGGIQQPLAVIETESGFVLADGLRRLRVARVLGMGKVPVIASAVPKGVSDEEYTRRLRFVLNHHRQDLLPTQRAELVETLRSQFGLQKQEVAAYLGIDEDSITNWLAIRTYIPAVQALMDAGRMTAKAARAFNGMTPEGQEEVLRKHGERLMSEGGGAMHRAIRAEYPPDKFPQFYRDAAKIKARLDMKQKPQRKGAKRPSLTSDEKRRLANSYEIKEAELEQLRTEQKQMKAEILAATPVIAAILRNPKLLALVPEEMREELERFGEAYV